MQRSLRSLAISLMVVACTSKTDSEQSQRTQAEQKVSEPEPEPEPIPKHHDLHLALKQGGLVRLADGQSTLVWDRTHVVKAVRPSRDGKLYAASAKLFRVWDSKVEDHDATVDSDESIVRP
jgi:glucose/arabinose dehydrogenase